MNKNNKILKIRRVEYSLADPDPVPILPLDPGWVKKQDPDLGSESGMEIIRIRDPGWKKFGGIRDKHPGSATLIKTLFLIKTLL